MTPRFLSLKVLVRLWASIMGGGSAFAPGGQAEHDREAEAHGEADGGPQRRGERDPPRAKRAGWKRAEADWFMGKDSKAHALAEVLRLAAGKLNLHSTLELHEQAAAEPGLDALDPGEVDDLLAIGAEKALRVESLLHRGERAEKLRLLVVEIQARVVALGLEQPEALHRHEPAAVALADEHLVLQRQAGRRRARPERRRPSVRVEL